MVTLAFAQVGRSWCRRTRTRSPAARRGSALNFESIPDFLVGVLNTKHLYWLALGYAAVVFLIVRWAVEQLAGPRARRRSARTSGASRCSGCSPYRFKLLAFVLASFLATAGGVVWLLVLGTGASPQVTTASFTLTLLVMVVLGGAGTRCGALLGGFLYTLADQRLGTLAGSSRIDDLPTVLSTPLSEPLFILGTLFILLVFFVPGGLASIGPRVKRMRRLPPMEGMQ